MNTLTDILAAPFGFALLAFTTWRGWAIWLAVVTGVAIAFRHELAVIVTGLRTAGSNALRSIRRKDRS